MFRNSSLTILFVLSGVLVASPSSAQPKVAPIAVDFQIESEGLTGAIPKTDRDAVRAAVRQRLFDELTRRATVSAWEFVLAPAASPATLLFSVKEDQPNTAHLALTFTVNNTPVPLPPNLDVSWLKPGDTSLNGWPTAADVIAKDFIRLLLTSPNEASIHDVLKKTVPVSMSAQWVTAPDLRIVLALPWERFSNLSESRFRLACTSTGGSDEVTSEARGLHASFTPVPPAAPYEALVVVPVARKNGDLAPATLQSLQLGLVFLDTYIPPNPWAVSPPP